MKAMLEFPAVRGIQAGREYYVSMCPLKIVNKIFVFHEPTFTPELRAQRQINRVRVPEMTRYLVENPSSYVFSAITASIDGDAKFVPNSDDPDEKMGRLSVPMASRIVINDGQHRSAAISAALEQAPELGDETISVVLFHDRGLARCQQMFADLNRYAVRPPRSLNVLYDHRDDRAKLAKDVIGAVSGLRNIVEMEKASLSPRSKELFTLSAIYTASAALLMDFAANDTEVRSATAIAFWRAICDNMPDWSKVQSGALTAGAVRDTYVHSHGVILHALGRIGNQIAKAQGDDFTPFKALNQINWRRDALLWDGRAVVAGRVSKTHQSVTLAANVVKTHLGLPLTADEQALENAFGRDIYVA